MCIRDSIMAILGRARAHYMLGRYADALEGYQKALIKMPNLTDPDPRIGLGCCLWQLGFKDQAKVAWERSLSLVCYEKHCKTLFFIKI